MSTSFEEFARFYSPLEAEDLMALLAQNNIPYTLTKAKRSFDAPIIGNIQEPTFILSIPTTDFFRAHLLYNKIADSLEPAKDIEQNEQKPDAPERLANPWIVLGYLFSLILLAGLLFGLSIISANKRLVNGDKVKVYDKYSIRHGKIMLSINILSSLFWITDRFNLF